MNAYIDTAKWQLAECRKVDPELFFDNATINQAKAICKTCPLIVACAQYAINSGMDYGVWGGLSETDRAMLKRKPLK